jgi:hypothetical protein
MISTHSHRRILSCVAMLGPVLCSMGPVAVVGARKPAGQPQLNIVSQTQGIREASTCLGMPCAGARDQLTQPSGRVTKCTIARPRE